MPVDVRVRAVRVLQAVISGVLLGWVTSFLGATTATVIGVTYGIGYLLLMEWVATSTIRNTMAAAAWAQGHPAVAHHALATDPEQGQLTRTLLRGSSAVGMLSVADGHVVFDPLPTLNPVHLPGARWDIPTDALLHMSSGAVGGGRTRLRFYPNIARRREVVLQTRAARDLAAAVTAAGGPLPMKERNGW